MTAPATTAPLPPPTKTQRNLVFGLIATAIVLGWIGDAFWASLVDRSPITLLLLNAKPRYQILVTNQLPLYVFLPVALARLVCTKPLVWLAGGWYGPRTVDWVGARTERGGRLLGWAQRNFPKRGWIVMCITTSNPVCLLAGSVGYPLARLMIWAVVGTTIRLLAVVIVGDVFSEAISAFTDWVVDHRVPVVLASIAVVVALVAWQRRRGISPLDELQSFEDAVEDAAEESALRDREARS
jgi:membrane protein DedA with SNARE-associated domain